MGPQPRHLTLCDLINAGRPMEPWKLMTGLGRMTQMLECQGCQCQPSSASCPVCEPPPLQLLTGQWSCRTSSPPSHIVHPRWLAAVTEGGGGVPDGEACCRMGLLLSVWAMSQVITSTHLIHHAQQTDTNKEDTFLPPLPLPQSSPLQPFLCFPLSLWANGSRRKKEDQSSGSPSLLEAMRVPEKSARWCPDSHHLCKIQFAQNDRLSKGLQERWE